MLLEMPEDHITRLINSAEARNEKVTARDRKFRSSKALTLSVDIQSSPGKLTATDTQKCYIMCHKKIDCSALLAGYKNEGKYDTSNVIYSDGKVVLYDKKKSNKEMQYIDYGLSILTKRIISQCIPNGIVYDLGDCYNELSNKNQLAGYKVTKRFYEIGSKSGLKEFKEYVKTIIFLKTNIF